MGLDYRRVTSVSHLGSCGHAESRGLHTEQAGPPPVSGHSNGRGCAAELELGWTGLGWRPGR